MARNPHFDDKRVIWKDEYSGRYQPIDYAQQFDHEWRLFLEKQPGFVQHTGVETDDVWINDRVFDLTGVKDFLPGLTPPSVDRNIGGRQALDLKFDVNHFRGRRCLDVACGAGRWTRALMALGAQVKSMDVSENALKSVRRFNQDVERLDIFDLPRRSEMQNAFDFVLAWGVIHHTHDPKVAFEHIAKAVKPGGECYVMVYAPTYHNSPQVLAQRRHYHTALKTFEEKLAYAYSIADRRENAQNYLDMLNTFYNWVVEEETIHEWYHNNGFRDVITLNASERNYSSYHVFGRKRHFELPLYDDRGDRMVHPVKFDPARAIPLPGPFQKELGLAWYVLLREFADQADGVDHPSRSKLILLENGKPLWLRHEPHDEIRMTGLGRYSHWGDGLLYFSTSDNTNPNTNGRKYSVVQAEA